MGTIVAVAKSCEKGYSQKTHLGKWTLILRNGGCVLPPTSQTMSSLLLAAVPPNQQKWLLFVSGYSVTGGRSKDGGEIMIIFP